MIKDEGIRYFFPGVRSPEEVKEEQRARAIIKAKVDSVIIPEVKIPDPVLPSIDLTKFKSTPTKKKTGFTQKEYENYIATRPSRSESRGAWTRFKKANEEAVRKDEALAKAKKKMSALDWVDSNVALWEPDIATQKQKDTLNKFADQKIFKNNINNPKEHLERRATTFKRGGK